MNSHYHNEITQFQVMRNQKRVNFFVQSNFDFKLNLNTKLNSIINRQQKLQRFQNSKINKNKLFNFVYKVYTNKSQVYSQYMDYIQMKDSGKFQSTDGSSCNSGETKQFPQIFEKIVQNQPQHKNGKNMDIYAYLQLEKLLQAREATIRAYIKKNNRLQIRIQDLQEEISLLKNSNVEMLSQYQKKVVNLKLQNEVLKAELTKKAFQPSNLVQCSTESRSPNNNIEISEVSQCKYENKPSRNCVDISQIKTQIFIEPSINIDSNFSAQILQLSKPIEKIRGNKCPIDKYPIKRRSFKGSRESKPPGSDRLSIKGHKSSLDKARQKTNLDRFDNIREEKSTSLPKISHSHQSQQPSSNSQISSIRYRDAENKANINILNKKK